MSCRLALLGKAGRGGSLLGLGHAQSVGQSLDVARGLLRLGFGILTFNDVPDAHKELMQEIDMAKVDLRKLGVDVD